MAGQVTPDGHVIPPLNITAPAPILNLRGFQWQAVDDKIHAPLHSQADDGDTPKAEGHAPQVDGHPSQEQMVESQAAQIHVPLRREIVPTAVPAPQVPTIASDKVGAAMESQFASQLDPLNKPIEVLKFPLAQFQGAYAGNGFNMIFRPRSKKANDPNDKASDAKQLRNKPLKGPDDNILELNLTTEQLTFGAPLGDIPNRGFGDQPDITLGGVPYVQTVQDTTNPLTGKGDRLDPAGIHFEPGVWLFVPNADFHAKKIPSVVRMASIPHGTTINLQGLIPNEVPNPSPNSLIGGVAGPPDFTPAADSTPFFVESGEPQPFPSMDANAQNTFRIPQDLSNFKGTITTEIIKNPHKVLENAIKGLKITETITFEVFSGPPKPEAKNNVSKTKAELNGGGTANISFLAGKQEPITTNAPGTSGSPIAHADFMKAKYWIEVVQYPVTVPSVTGQVTLMLKPNMPAGSTAPTPVFFVTTPKKGVPQQQEITIPGIQIQSSQTVNLNFGPPIAKLLTWPHISVSTLVPTTPQVFKMPE